jgi:hypothetical protein
MNNALVKNKRRSPVLIILLLILLAGMGFLGYNLFNIRTIEVTGNKNKKADYVIQLSGIEKGMNVFKIDDGILKETLEKDPYIAFIEAKRVYPDKIVLKIKERTPAALILNEDNTLLLDSEGYVLKIEKNNENDNYPAVSGLNVSNFSLGKQVGFADEAQYKAMKTIIGGIYTEGINALIAEINLFNINDIKMITRKGIQIKFGSYETTEKKILWIKKVLAYFDEKGIDKGTVDVSTGEFASYNK